MVGGSQEYGGRVDVDYTNGRANESVDSYLCRMFLCPWPPTGATLPPTGVIVHSDPLQLTHLCMTHYPIFKVGIIFAAAEGIIRVNKASTHSTLNTKPTTHWTNKLTNSLL